MAISYKKLWKLLIDKDMTAVQLRERTGIAVQFSHEKCIRHIVKGSDQHTDDAGKSQLADQSAYGFLCHFVEFLLLPFVHISDLKRFRFIKIVYHTFKKRKVTLLQHRR